MKRKERAAGYIRESNPNLADSNTIESQAKLVREHCIKQGYDYPPHHEFREALSAHKLSYLQRPRLVELLEAAKRHEFDVVVISELRSLTRKGQIETFILYDMLQRYEVRLETVNERFDNDPFGMFKLSTLSFIAEAERMQIVARMERGRADRIAIGNAPNGSPKPAYGYRFLDTEREVKGRYEFDMTIIYVDAEGNEWSPYKVCLYIFDLLKQRVSLMGIARILNEIGLPAPHSALRKKSIPIWRSSSIHKIITNRIVIGEVWCNKYKRNGKGYEKRPQEEQILLTGIAPAMIDCETFDMIQRLLQWNKEDNVRNSTHPEVGILKSHVFCGICGCRAYVSHPKPTTQHGRSPQYCCRQKKTATDYHNTVIAVSLLDQAAWEKVMGVLKNPMWIREKVKELRENNQPVVESDIIEKTVESLDTQMVNLFSLAQHATSQQTIDQLTVLMKDLERQKREAEALLTDVEEDEEERREIESEIDRFEAWLTERSHLFDDPNYMPTYDEKRMAVHSLGVTAIVFPANGEYPFRYQINVAPPAIMEKMKSTAHNYQRKWMKQALLTWTT